MGCIGAPPGGQLLARHQFLPTLLPGWFYERLYALARHHPVLQVWGFPCFNGRNQRGPTPPPNLVVDAGMAGTVPGGIFFRHSSHAFFRPSTFTGSYLM